MLKSTNLSSYQNSANYNFFEESREFFTKRFMFLVNQGDLNITKTVKLSETPNLGSNINNMNFFEINSAVNNIVIQSSYFNKNDLENFNKINNLSNLVVVNPYKGEDKLDFTVVPETRELLNLTHGSSSKEVFNSTVGRDYSLHDYTKLKPIK
jgi:hypothetical protein